MTTSAKMGWPISNPRDSSFYDSYIGTVAAIDASAAALKEDRNLIIQGLSNLVLAPASNPSVSWSSNILIFSPNGFVLTIPPGSANVLDGQMLVVNVVRSPTGNVTLTPYVSSVINQQVESVVLARRSGNTLLSRAGFQIPASGSGTTVASFVSVPYSTSMTIDAANGTLFQIIATNAVNFTINNPSTFQFNGQRISIQILNQTSPSANLGTITWGSQYTFQNAYNKPNAAGKITTVDFVLDQSASKWREVSRSETAVTVTSSGHLFDVTAFGADPTGISDSQPGFAAALTAMAADTQAVNGASWGPAGYATSPIGLASGGEIWVPRGVYLFNNPFHIGAYVTIRGENSVLVAKDFSTDIFVFDQIYRQQIYNLQFLGGRYQVTGVNGTDDIRFSNCVWCHPGTAGIYNQSNTTNRWHFEDCDFLGQFSVGSGQMWLSSGAATDGRGGVDTLVMRRCMCLSSQTVPFVFGPGDYRLSQCFFVQGGVGASWFQLYGSNLVITDSKFTGESGSPNLFELRPLNRPGDGFYPLDGNKGNIQLVDSVIYSRQYMFYTLPEKFVTRGLSGVQDAFYFDSGISEYQLANTNIEDWEIDFSSGRNWVMAYNYNASWPVTNQRIHSDVMNRLLYKNGHRTNTNQKPTSDQFLGYARLGQYPVDGTAIWTGGNNGIFNNVTPVRPTDAVTGRQVFELTSTANGGNFTFGPYAGLWNTLAGPGQYTLSIPVEVVTRSTLTVRVVAGTASRNNELSTGRHVINLPFSWTTQPKVWHPNTIYTQGDIVTVGGGPYAPGAYGVTLYCISTGTSASTYTPTGAGSFASPYIDGSAQWVRFDYMMYNIGVPVMANGDKVRVGDARVFKGTYTGDDWRVVTVGAAIPTRGTWTAGDIVENGQPQSGFPMGWVCATSGTIAPAWTTNTVYYAGDTVLANGAYWICTNPDLSGHTSASSGTGPSNSPTYIWPANDLAIAPFFNDNGVQWCYYNAGATATFLAYGLIG